MLSTRSAIPPQIGQFLQHELGKRFVLNLHWSLEDGLPVELGQRLVQAVPLDSSTSDSFDTALDALRKAVFATPAGFQFRGQQTSRSGLWMTVMSAADLLVLVREALNDKEWDQRFAGFASAWKPTEQTYVSIEMAVNDSACPLRFLMNKVPKKPGTDGPLRPNPRWFSRWCKFSESCGVIRVPSERGASRMRDWLGLTHKGRDVPLFVLRARMRYPATQIGGHRPTICEGFDNPVFKYPATDEYMAELCGSTADLERLQGWSDGPIDGGPEIVSPEAYFDSGTHECKFLGFAGDIRYDYQREEFHRHLLKASVSLEAIAAEVARKLDLIY